MAESTAPIAKPIVTGLIPMAHAAADLQPSVNFNKLLGWKFAAVCGTFGRSAMGPPGKRTS